MKFFGTTPPDFILFFIGFEILSHYLIPIAQIVFLPYSYIGILLVFVGITLSYIWLPRKAKTTSDIFETPSKLVTTGPYKFSRNPTYLGMASILTGIAIFLGSLITFIFPLVFIITTNIFVIPIEERNLKRAFRKKYTIYKQKVRKWI